MAHEKPSEQGRSDYQSLLTEETRPRMTAMEDGVLLVFRVFTLRRKKAILLKRYITPQRDVIHQLRNADLDRMDEIHRRRLYEAHDHVTRYAENLDTVRESAHIVKDELSNLLAGRLNKNIYMLSIIAATFQPLRFLTGLLRHIQDIMSLIFG